MPLYINKEAAVILKQCDGIHSVENIVENVAVCFKVAKAEAESNVRFFIQNGLSSGLLECSSAPFKNNESNFFNSMIDKAGFVQISIDGLEAYHTTVRGKQDAFKRSIETVKCLSKKDIPVRVTTCLINQSEDEVFALVSLIKKKEQKVIWYPCLMK
ncbi:MAG: PqqD family peptide modification chaperone [Breznakia sp.]